MGQPLVVGVDVGSQSAKAALFDLAGTTLAGVVFCPPGTPQGRR